MKSEMEIKREVTDKIMVAIEHRIEVYEADVRVMIYKADLIRELEQLRIFVKESKNSMRPAPISESAPISEY